MSIFSMYDIVVRNTSAVAQQKIAATTTDLD